VKPNRLSGKSRAIVAALAKGRSCEQILAADPTLTYHDIFRAVAEMPENRHILKLASARAVNWRRLAKSDRRPAMIAAMPKARD
jgi:hypothetical protein